MHKSPKRNVAIYDCFPFFNEIELLKMRFAELYEHVDYFVLVESTETFTGNKKPLYFNENKSLFSSYLDKVIHVIVEESIDTDDAWIRDIYQRNQIVRGLINCLDNDIIFVSDVDELINAKIISKVRSYFSYDRGDIRCLRQDFYRFFLNRFYRKKWRGTTVATYKTLMQYSPDWMRQMGGKVKPFNRAGWHFSSMGGHSNFVYKVESFAHTESDTIDNKSRENFIREYTKLKKVALGRKFPRYIRQNKQALQKAGLLE